MFKWWFHMNKPYTKISATHSRELNVTYINEKACHYISINRTKFVSNKHPSNKHPFKYHFITRCKSK